MAGTPKILLLAHDVSDAAIARRLTMLREGGANIVVAGFRRTEEPVADLAGCTVVDLGRTYNQGFARRILSVLRQVLSIKKRRRLFENADIIIARNLEMLAIAVRGRSVYHPDAVIVYECLDIHRLLLGRGITGIILRALEGWLSRRASALITSSPAFVSDYFSTRSGVRLPVKLIENKVLMSSVLDRSAPLAGPPWIIGWFGILRCKKSLHVLAELVRQSGGKIQVVLRGRPALDAIDDFHHVIAATPGMRFLGPYTNPDDLASIYRDIHFVWAIDMYEEGLNSSWLLPNRLYESGAFGAVPLALASVETGRFLRERNIGVLLEEPLPSTLAAFFSNLTAQHYQSLRTTIAEAPRKTWIYEHTDCVDLVEYLRSLEPAGGTARV